MLRAFTFVLVSCATTAALAQSDWVNISDALVAKLTAEGKTPAWPGQTAGMACDRTTGHVYLVVAGQGLFLSTDRGATFARCDDGKVSGRCETGYALNLDPAGKRLACFMLDGKCGMSLDAGKTWQGLKDVGRNWDYAAVDWSSERPQTIFAMLHESGGQTMLSTDGGQSWTKADKDAKFSGLGAVDAKTLLRTKGEGIERSTDTGATWTKVSDLTPVGRLAIVFGKTVYWLGKDGLLASKDAGVTWQRQGGEVQAAWGPYFGKDERQIVVLGKAGIFETADACNAWQKVGTLPAKGFETNNPGWFVNFAWDPQADVFYISRMGQPAFRRERKR